MYCPKCGAFIPEGAQLCPNCQETAPQPNNNAARPESSAQPENGVYYNTPNQNNQQPGGDSYFTPPNQNNFENSYYTQSADEQADFAARDKLSTANTLGILSIILGIILTPIVGIICGAIGLVQANSIADSFNKPALMEEKRKAKRLNIIGIVLPLAIYIVLIIFAILFTAIFAAGMSELAYF